MALSASTTFLNTSTDVARSGVSTPSREFDAWLATLPTKDMKVLEPTLYLDTLTVKTAWDAWLDCVTMATPPVVDTGAGLYSAQLAAHHVEEMRWNDFCAAVRAWDMSGVDDGDAWREYTLRRCEVSRELCLLHRTIAEETANLWACDWPRDMVDYSKETILRQVDAVFSAKIDMDKYPMPGHCRREATLREFEEWLNTLPTKDMEILEPTECASNPTVGMAWENWMAHAESREVDSELGIYDQYSAENSYWEELMSVMESTHATDCAFAWCCFSRELMGLRREIEHGRELLKTSTALTQALEYAKSRIQFAVESTMCEWAEVECETCNGVATHRFLHLDGRADSLCEVCYVCADHEERPDPFANVD